MFFTPLSCCAAHRSLLQVPELEDLEARGYFSRSEIKRIVQRRQDFEYALKRRAALKEDYLRRAADAVEGGGPVGRLGRVCRREAGGARGGGRAWGQKGRQARAWGQKGSAPSSAAGSRARRALGGSVAQCTHCTHPAPRLAAARRYVEYETRLEALRQHRRRERGITGKKSLADYCIPRRIHFIYERATRKFRWGAGGFAHAPAQYIAPLAICVTVPPKRAHCMRSVSF